MNPCLARLRINSQLPHIVPAFMEMEDLLFHLHINQPENLKLFFKV